MKIKQKLHLGFGLLFVVVIFFGGLSLFYLKQIANSSKIILKDNFATLSYTREMRSLLNGNDLPLPAPVIAKFSAALLKEQNNLTEEGESLEVEKLTKSFGVLINTATPIEQHQLLKNEILRSLERIEGLNLDAVIRKSDKAERSTQNATLYL